jgi:hypothetical protein
VLYRDEARDGERDRDARTAEAPPSASIPPQERMQGLRGRFILQDRRVSSLPCSRTNGGRRRSHPPPEVGRQVPPLHRPRRDPRHAHANANARIRHRRHLRTPTVVLGPRSAPSGPPAATPLTATAAAPQAPTRPGSKASTPRLVASLPTHHTSVPRSPSSSTQVGVLVSCAASQQTRTERR